MRLTAEIAQPIVDRAIAIVNRNINLMDQSGIIVASGDPTRIGTYHEGAARVLKTGKPQEIHPGEQERYAGSKPGINLPIYLDDRSVGVVGITGPPAEVRAFGELLREMAQLMLAQARTARLERTAAWARESVLRELLTGLEPIGEQGARQAQLLELNQETAYQVLIAEADESLLPTLAQAARQAGAAPVIATGPWEGRLVLVAGHPSTRLDELVHQAAPPGTVLAAGLVATGLTGLRESYRSALATLKAGVKAGGGGLLRADDLRLERLLAALPAEEARRFVERTLGGLAPATTPQGALARQTVAAYLRHGMSRTRAAESLGVHRHTMINRLDQVAGATGLDPREANGAIHFALALLLERLFRQDVGSGPLEWP